MRNDFLGCFVLVVIIWWPSFVKQDVIVSSVSLFLQLLSFLQGLFTFYHEGYELAQEFAPYKQQLQFNLQNVRLSVFLLLLFFSLTIRRPPSYNLIQLRNLSKICLKLDKPTILKTHFMSFFFFNFLVKSPTEKN